MPSPARRSPHAADADDLTRKQVRRELIRRLAKLDDTADFYNEIGLGTVLDPEDAVEVNVRPREVV